MTAHAVDIDPVALAALERLLTAGDAADGPARLSRLDGFLTAVAAGPEPDDPVEWLVAAVGYAGEAPEEDSEGESLVMLVLDRYAQALSRLEGDPPRCAPIGSTPVEGTPI